MCDRCSQFAEKFSEASDILAKLLESAVQEHGELSIACAPLYYNYGRVLLLDAKASTAEMDIILREKMEEGFYFADAPMNYRNSIESRRIDANYCVLLVCNLIRRIRTSERSKRARCRDGCTRERLRRSACAQLGYP
jgi:hypothetical protein